MELRGLQSLREVAGKSVPQIVCQKAGNVAAVKVLHRLFLSGFDPRIRQVQVRKIFFALSVQKVGLWFPVEPACIKGAILVAHDILRQKSAFYEMSSDGFLFKMICLLYQTRV